MNNEIKTSVVKYIIGQANEEEIAEVREWIRTDKLNEEYYIQLYEAWQNALSANSGIIDEDRAYQFFIEKIKEKKKSRLYTIRWWRVAAAAIIIVACSLAYVYYQGGKNSPELSKVNVLDGTTQKLVLADGSTIWINAGSQLSYNNDFGTASRTVYLDGEAYFDIAKSKNNIPFIIQTKHFTIRDIGTVFNIKAYSEDSSFEATVIEGKISVEGKLSKQDDENSKVFLKRKQVLTINSHSEQDVAPVKVVTIDSSQIKFYNGWKDNLLAFEDISFKELAKIIERRYDVEIIIDDKELETYKYSGSFRNVDDIKKVMTIIKATTPIKYQINERTVFISAGDQ